jgi:hypothetical protein
MPPTIYRLGAVALATAATAAAAAAAPTAAHARAPIHSCGNATASGGLLIGDISARRVTCRTARRVARAVPKACGADTGSCTVRGFTCFVAEATEELRFARCSKPHGNDELHRVIRFDFGS